MSVNFHLAPPPKLVDGLLAVAIDIQSIEAVFTFDGSSQAAVADATMTYTVGPTDGNPIFDLRQTITQAWLDGAVFAPAALAAHDFGGGSLTELRIIQSVQTAGSVHQLRVQYALGTPLSGLGGSYPPGLVWSTGPRLRFSVGMSDLNPGRYAEAWLPANLLFDQFTIQLEMQINNTLAAHTLITNGVVTSLGTNHWSIAFPARFTALSALVELRATDTLETQTDTVTLPVSGKTVSIEVWKLTGGTANLINEINILKDLLIDNENNYGPYLHGNRFSACFFQSGGMEYEGATTTSSGALNHETFHSWYGRGIKPAGQADGWWDEGFTTWHDAGAASAVPFDFADPPRVLCSRDPFQRRTPSNSYSDGNTFWQGMAALLGVNNQNNLMRDLYNTYRGQPVSTQMIEEFLLSKSGAVGVVDAFHRFVYGFGDPAPAPDLWIKDAPSHAGADAWSGTFWDSPDVWVRNQDDDGTSHQNPEYGQDNWFYTRVRNLNSAGASRHFIVAFNVKSFAGTEFIYPSDFLPCTVAQAEFDLGAGETRIVHARWPSTLVPAAGTHTCLLAAVLTRADHPIAGRHVWEHNNLAQKNLTVVDLLPNQFVIIPVVIRNIFSKDLVRYDLEVWRDREMPEYAVSLVSLHQDLFRLAPKAKKTIPLDIDFKVPPQPDLLDCGGRIDAKGALDSNGRLTSDHPERIVQRFAGAVEVPLPTRKKAVLPIDLPYLAQHNIGLKIAIPADAPPGAIIKTHFVQRNSKTKQITGGVAVQIHVK